MSTSQKLNDVYTKVTDGIIRLLEEGVCVWKKPWKEGAYNFSTRLMNGSTGRRYSGINCWLLNAFNMDNGFFDHRFFTFKQVKDLGGSVLAGSKGCVVIHFEFITINKTKLDKDGKEVIEVCSIPDIKYWTVFSLEQTTGIPAEKLASEPIPDYTTNDYETLLASMPSIPRLSFGEPDRAFYRPSQDLIRLPHETQFKTKGHFMATLFHELGHSTGHSSRLNRDGVTQSMGFGSENYSKEELVAECASAFLCSHFGIEVDLEPSAGYIASWLKVLKNDRKFLINAFSQAYRACQYILGELPDFPKANKPIEIVTEEVEPVEVPVPKVPRPKPEPVPAPKPEPVTPETVEPAKPETPKPKANKPEPKGKTVSEEEMEGRIKRANDDVQRFKAKLRTYEGKEYCQKYWEFVSKGGASPEGSHLSKELREKIETFVENSWSLFTGKDKPKPITSVTRQDDFTAKFPFEKSFLLLKKGFEPAKVTLRAKDLEHWMAMAQKYAKSAHAKLQLA